MKILSARSELVAQLLLTLVLLLQLVSQLNLELLLRPELLQHSKLLLFLTAQLLLNFGFVLGVNLNLRPRPGQLLLLQLQLVACLVQKLLLVANLRLSLFDGLFLNPLPVLQLQAACPCTGGA